MKVIVYTANINRFDEFYNPKYQVPEYDYYYYTDVHYTESKWKFIKIDVTGDERRVARYYKINSHELPEHDISVWIDSSFRINGEIKELVEWAAQRPEEVFTFGHPHRNCTYQEATACKRLKKDNDSIIDKQMHKYVKDMFPRNKGMFSTGIMIRKNTLHVHHFNKRWHQELKEGSLRDQLSIVYAAWKTNTRIRTIAGNIYRNPYAKYVGHSIQV